LINFIAAVYNEENEIDDLIEHIYPHVDHIFIADDGSTDTTVQHLEKWMVDNFASFFYVVLPHTGLPETVKAEALAMVPEEDDWVLMLDADERFAEGVLDSITAFHNSSEAEKIDYVYFRQVEVIDGVPVREFIKCKLFRKRAMKFPLENIHADDVLTGNGIARQDWIVLHRKTTNKQVMRETEYLNTYKKLLTEGKIDEGRYKWLVGLHHYVKPH
jgi:glycosyltransferase involved in cell wall biosynthesis